MVWFYPWVNFFLYFKLIFINYHIENDCKDKIEPLNTRQKRKSSHGPLMVGQELTGSLRYLLIGWGRQRTRTRLTVFRRSFGGVAIVTNSTLLAFDALRYCDHMPGIRNQGNGNKYIIIKKNGDNQYYYIKNKRVQSLYKDNKDISTSAILRIKF